VRFEPYALPRAIKVIDRLPLKDNGKVDRAAILRLFAA
jgi:acyl-coenzyme A synthetase/AMP-(fatty) acid ligase